MNEFLIDLQTAITAVHARAYREWAKSGAALPYIVWNLPGDGTGDHDSPGCVPRVLEVDLWGANTDAVALETLVDDVNAALNQHTFNGAGYYARLARVGRLDIPDPDPKLRRRQLRYNVKYVKRS